MSKYVRGFYVIFHYILCENIHLEPAFPEFSRVRFRLITVLCHIWIYSPPYNYSRDDY